MPCKHPICDDSSANSWKAAAATASMNAAAGNRGCPRTAWSWRKPRAGLFKFAMHLQSESAMLVIDLAEDQRHGIQTFIIAFQSALRDGSLIVLQYSFRWCFTMMSILLKPPRVKKWITPVRAFLWYNCRMCQCMKEWSCPESHFPPCQCNCLLLYFPGSTRHKQMWIDSTHPKWACS